MSLFGRLFGNERPKLPAGGRAVTVMSTSQPPKWTVRIAIGDQEQTTALPRVPRSPTFTDFVKADEWAQWVNGGPAFQYPSDGPV